MKFSMPVVRYGVVVKVVNVPICVRRFKPSDGKSAFLKLLNTFRNTLIPVYMP